MKKGIRKSEAFIKLLMEKRLCLLQDFELVNDGWDRGVS